MNGEKSFRHDIAVEMTSRSADALLAELADRQHGAVSHAQLTELGLGRGAIQHRVQRKRLHPVHRGVYSVGRRRLTRSGVWMAAVLACGGGAVLSHRSAAALWGIRRGDPSRTEVTAPGRVGRRRGIRAHQASLPNDESTEVDGIPVTTVARTILDLAAVDDRHRVERAMEQAEALRLADTTPLAALAARYPGRRGTAVLKAITGKGPRAAGITRSHLEDRFLRFLAERRLPPPDPNAWLHLGEDWIEGDCVWPEQRLVVELDSWQYHATKAAFRRDRARDRRLQLAGWVPIRVTAWDVEEEPDRLEAELVGLLRAGARAAPLRPVRAA
jgi:predicted transcriptional regulator of viral defense system